MSSKQVVLQRVQGMPAQDGAGVKLKRVINQPEFRSKDPFLLLDEFKSDDPNDYIAGFPSHPHRGFCTLSYMLAGTMAHEDSQGNHGEVDAGGLQWMKAARGLIHSEMPKQENGLMWGFQLWLNLPASEKMSAPEYADIPSSAVPEVTIEGGKVRVLAGEFGQEVGPVNAKGRDFLYLDYRLSNSTKVQLPLQKQDARLLYVYRGELTIDNEKVSAGELLDLNPTLEIQLEVSEGSSFLLLAAQSIGEPIAQYGPFVMNTESELRQAFADYQNGTLV